MRVLFFLLTFSSIFVQNVFAQKLCYSCASQGLRSKWYLTGLPPVSSSLFTTSCDHTPAVTASCAGPCMVMSFTDPDTSGNTIQTYYVRGCHQTLTQSRADRFDDNSTRTFCEIDETYSLNGQDKTSGQSTRMVFLLCNDNECNNQQFDVNSRFTCDNQTTGLLNGNAVNCYDCLAKQGSNCFDSRCSKKYCLKKSVSIGGGTQILKTCSNVNIYGVDNTCQTNDVSMNPAG
ncbi:unnamed protein product [Caenorhabditis angaria]|uniref:DUF281 domain-containing protein n=1 Tax=Caenorhabditis angaria TaxID=860376 RepID=A0A9P1N5Q5_9PELO|nr:unnamed protein product [Caenorhabditis angaria]